MESKILLESGTNELEILEFSIGDLRYGINVAKVVEIIQYSKPTIIPNTHPSIEGIFMPRNEIITVLDLAKHLNINHTTPEKRHMTIITNFNQVLVGFHVGAVNGIHRVSWESITKPEATINGSGNGIATGILKMKDDLIVILDFEKIVSDASPATGMNIDTIKKMGPRERNNKPILIAEDSPMLEKILNDCLTEAGYTNLTIVNNGLEAWNKLREYKESGLPLEQQVSLVLTDIEMPQMDGHHLIKLIRDDYELSHLPIIVFSSLVSTDMKKKGEALGATAQISKPEIGQLVETLDRYVI